MDVFKRRKKWNANSLTKLDGNQFLCWGLAPPCLSSSFWLKILRALLLLCNDKCIPSKPPSTKNCHLKKNLRKKYFSKFKNLRKMNFVTPKFCFKPGNKCKFWLILKPDFVMLYQTWEKVFIRISKHWEDFWKGSMQRGVFDKIWSVWIANETLSQVFVTSSQFKEKLMSKQSIFYQIWVNRELKSSKSMLIKTG